MTSEFKKKWTKEALEIFNMMGLGLTISVVASFAVTNPTKWTYIGWGILMVFFATLATVFGYLMAKKALGKKGK